MDLALFKHRAREHGANYESREACSTCPSRCMDSKNTMAVRIGHNTDSAAVRMYGDPADPRRKLPPRFQPHNGLRGRRNLRVSA